MNVNAEPKTRLLWYRIFPSPLGHILIARSDRGIAAIEFLEPGKSLRASRLSRKPEIELARDRGGQDIEGACQDLLDYLRGRRRGFDWLLDLRWVRSEFHRSVLQATAAIPYGAVVSYAGLARIVGRPSAARAVAQALRWNPLPIVLPCHRVVGSSGALTGYAGNKVALKQRLLSLEGVPTVQARKTGPLTIQIQAMYVNHPGQQVYCLPTCPSVLACGRAPLLRIASRKRAEEADLAPCRICRPDLNPLPRGPGRPVFS
jgi:methylated-DNA-[protein]-cysteine S-methyltransferase